nr:MAG TPA: hypothetical protein [Caudoviricetes sp.]
MLLSFLIMLLYFFVNTLSITFLSFLIIFLID